MNRWGVRTKLFVPAERHPERLVGGRSGMPRIKVGGWRKPGDTDPLLVAGLAHMGFVTIHPFEDGNGRIARAIADLAHARSEGTGQRFYSMSGQIHHERKAYYNMLERTQKSDTDSEVRPCVIVRAARAARLISGGNPQKRFRREAPRPVPQRGPLSEAVVRIRSPNTTPVPRSRRFQTRASKFPIRPSTRTASLAKHLYV
jgi:hypothetical protein